MKTRQHHTIEEFKSVGDAFEEPMRAIVNAIDAHEKADHDDKPCMDSRLHAVAILYMLCGLEIEHVGDMLKIALRLQAQERAHDLATTIELILDPNHEEDKKHGA